MYALLMKKRGVKYKVVLDRHSHERESTANMATIRSPDMHVVFLNSPSDGSKDRTHISKY